MQCDQKYSEPETEEHLLGKQALYQWICKQQEVTDVVLEAWLPDTHQRPDIMFNYNGEKYVIEYQCTPISTEYFERHELYQAAGIHDIWVCGTEKYMKDNMRDKVIEQHCVGYYDTKCHKFIFPADNIYEDLLRRVSNRKRQNSVKMMSWLKCDYCHLKNIPFMSAKLDDVCLYDGSFRMCRLPSSAKVDFIKSKIKARNKIRGTLAPMVDYSKNIVNHLNKVYSQKGLTFQIDNTNTYNRLLVQLNWWTQLGAYHSHINLLLSVNYSGVRKLVRDIRDFYKENQENYSFWRNKLNNAIAWQWGFMQLELPVSSYLCSTEFDLWTEVIEFCADNKNNHKDVVPFLLPQHLTVEGDNQIDLRDISPKYIADMFGRLGFREIEIINPKTNAISKFVYDDSAIRGV